MGGSVEYTMLAAWHAERLREAEQSRLAQEVGQAQLQRTRPGGLRLALHFVGRGLAAAGRRLQMDAPAGGSVAG